MELEVGRRGILRLLREESIRVKEVVAVVLEACRVDVVSAQVWRLVERGVNMGLWRSGA